MKKSYVFAILIALSVFIEISSEPYISQKSINLQNEWESPNTTYKAKFKIFLHDLKQPWPWALKESWDAWNFAVNTNVELEYPENYTVSLKDRALLRIYQNKLPAYMAGVATVAFPIAASIDPIKNYMKKSTIRKNALSILNLKLTDLTPENFKERINEATRKAKLKHHPDKGGSGEITPEMINDARDSLLNLFKK